MTASPHDTKQMVREHYAKVARTEGTCGCGTGCCTIDAVPSARLGYAAEDLASLPAGADMGLGCGTPLAFARLRQGEIVLDLGSGGGIDCLLAARQVSPTGRVIGVDMTPEMVARARENAARVDAGNVEFRLGEIEAIPLPDRSVDVILSNCVINLSPDKPAVFREILRVLRPGGRLAISDIVRSEPLPPDLLLSPSSLVGCVAGAPALAELRDALAAAGFADIRIDVDDASKSFIADWNPGSGAEQFVASAAIHATRPKGEGCCSSASTSHCC